MDAFVILASAALTALSRSAQRTWTLWTKISAISTKSSTERRMAQETPSPSPSGTIFDGRRKRSDTTTPSTTTSQELVTHAAAPRLDSPAVAVVSVTTLLVSASASVGFRDLTA